jgi:hypothetical protein
MESAPSSQTPPPSIEPTSTGYAPETPGVTPLTRHATVKLTAVPKSNAVVFGKYANLPTKHHTKGVGRGDW